jgi:lipopolysaccharide export system permease protein
MQFVKLFFLGELFFFVMYLVVDFLQKVDDFIEHGASARGMVLFFIYKSPLILLQMVPVAVMIATITQFSLMKKNNELTAIKANGVSIGGLSLPLIWTAVVLSVGVFLFSELVVPYATSKSEEIWVTEVKKYGRKQLYHRYNIWHKGDNSIYWIGHLDAEKGILYDPKCFFFDESFTVARNIQAQKAVWQQDRWEFREGFVQKPVSEEDFHFERFEQLNVALPEKPKDFLRPVKEPEEMGYWELKRFSERIEREGYDATPFRVDLNIKLAFPVINLVMVLLGIPIALRLSVGGIPLAVSAGIGACFIYLVVFGFFRSLGLSGTLPPLLSAWLGNILFLLSGIYLMGSIRS